MSSELDVSLQKARMVANRINVELSTTITVKPMSALTHVERRRILRRLVPYRCVSTRDTMRVLMETVQSAYDHKEEKKEKQQTHRVVSASSTSSRPSPQSDSYNHNRSYSSQLHITDLPPDTTRQVFFYYL